MLPCVGCWALPRRELGRLCSCRAGAAPVSAAHAVWCWAGLGWGVPAAAVRMLPRGPADTRRMHVCGWGVPMLCAAWALHLSTVAADARLHGVAINVRWRGLAVVGR